MCQSVKGKSSKTEEDIQAFVFTGRIKSGECSLLLIHCQVFFRAATSSVLHVLLLHLLAESCTLGDRKTYRRTKL